MTSGHKLDKPRVLRLIERVRRRRHRSGVRWLTVESLEPRDLLSAASPAFSTSLADVQVLDRVAVVRLEDQPLLVTPPAAATTTTHQDTSPMIAARDGSSWVNQGDYYWTDGRAVPLYRSVSEVTVGLTEGATASQLLREYRRVQGERPELQVTRTLNGHLVTVSSGTPAVDLEAALAGLPSVAWTAPSFRNGESGLRQWLTNELFVKLQPGVDRAQFFAADTFAGYRPWWPDEAIATVVAGGLAALQAANALSTDPRVVWAEPNFYSGVQLCDSNGAPSVVTNLGPSAGGQPILNGITGGMIDISGTPLVVMPSPARTPTSSGPQPLDSGQPSSSGGGFASKAPAGGYFAGDGPRSPLTWTIERDATRGEFQGFSLLRPLTSGLSELGRSERRSSIRGDRVLGLTAVDSDSSSTRETDLDLSLSREGKARKLRARDAAFREIAEADAANAPAE